MNRFNHPGAVILIIDPDPLMLTGMAAVLDMQGYECHCARDAEAARRAVKTLPLDLIVCEMTMPGQSGAQLCQELMELASIQDVPVIFCSDGEVPQADGPLKQTFLLRRPFEPQSLVDEVANALWMPHLVSTRVRQKLAGQETAAHIQNASAIPAPASTRRSGSVEVRRRS